MLHIRYQGLMMDALPQATAPKHALVEGVMPPPDETRPDLLMPEGGFEPEGDPNDPFDAHLPTSQIVRNFWDLVRGAGLSEEQVEGVLQTDMNGWAKRYPDPTEGLRKAWGMMEKAYDLGADQPDPEKEVTWADLGPDEEQPTLESYGQPLI